MSTFVHQSGVVPILRNPHGNRIMLVTTRSGRWGIPKGTIESSASARDTAAREALEEAGIEGRIYPDCIGIYCVDKFDAIHEIQVFVMDIGHIHSVWDEQAWRDRDLVDPTRAHQLVWHPDLAALIEPACDLAAAVWGPAEPPNDG